MGYCPEGPASCIRQISEGISLSAGIPAGGCLRIDAVAVPYAMALIVLGMMGCPLRAMGRGPLRH
ncbi:MAG: hypothetical protein Q8N04_04900 [Nitrospira sp.]|nr:hypothetical protein [Nitrospira sp.]